MKTPIYNALGRICKVGMFESNFTDDNYPQSAQYGNYSKMYYDREGILQHFSGNTDVVVYFCDRSGKTQALSSSTFGRIQFINIPAEEPRLSDWFQDFVHFVPVDKLQEPSQILFGVVATNAEPTRFRESQCIAIAANEASDASDYIRLELDKVCAGGNVQRGYHDGKDYLVVGPKEHTTLTTEELESYFLIDPGLVFRCALPPDSPFADEFYHLDLYLTLAGKIKRKSTEHLRETVFIAQAYGYKSTEARQQLRQVFRDFFDHATFFRPVKLPLIILPGIDDKNYLFSYNNCILENYIEGDEQKVKMHFPDFRDKMKRAVKDLFSGGTHFEKQRFSIMLDKAFVEIQEYSGVSNTELFQVSPETHNLHALPLAPGQLNLKVDELIDMCESKIKALKDDFFMDEPQSISNDFANKAKYEHGGLHCIIKVMQRDLVVLQ